MSGEFFDDGPIVVRRSELERFAACPMQARLVAEHEPPVGVAAVVGAEGHRVIGEAIQEYIDADGNLFRKEMVDTLMSGFRSTRPDVQQDVLEAFAPSAYAIAELIVSRNPVDFLRFDGGKDKRSGQLSYDSPSGVRVTSELDCLLLTKSKEVLYEADWKSGRKQYDVESVAASFQFGCVHPVLVFTNYPEVNQLDIQVWPTRSGRPIPSVQFYRSRLQDYIARLEQVISVWLLYEREAMSKVPCWASTEKCRICDVAARCPAVDRPLPADDGELLRKLIATERHAEALHDELRARAAKCGDCLVTAHGTYELSGTEKPRKTWKVKQPSTTTE